MNLQRITTVTLVSVSLISAPIAAQATDWFMAASGQSSKVKHFVDRDSIVRSGNSAKANVLVVFDIPTEEGTVGYYASSEFSCAERKGRDIKTTYLRQDGSTRRDNTLEDWVSFRPDSVAEGVLKQVCGY